MPPPAWGDRRCTRVGLLGGSFNPAHDGHLHITREARRRLQLDQVWWLVSPQNPLKPRSGMGTPADRMAGARQIASEPWIAVTDIEQHLGSGRTWETLEKLRQRFPKTQFVWLMGADNLAQMPRWARWSKIFQTVHIAVFDRSPYSYKALSGKASRRFIHSRYGSSRPVGIWYKSRPTWVYLTQPRHGASSTKIRTGTVRTGTVGGGE